MSYRFKLREPLADGVHRVGLGQIEMAEAKLRGHDDPVAAVHDTRRCFKRLRALLRLIRFGLEENVYQREAKRLATTGRMLAGVRDGHVMLQTLHKLGSRNGPLPDGAHERLSEIIGASDNADPAKLRESTRRALGQLPAVRKFFSGPALDRIEFGHVLEGMEKVYKTARRAQRDCHREPSDEAFHTWRKSAQLHWRHMQLLSRAWPGALTARAMEAKEVSQLLGEDHDFAVLAAFARSHSDHLSASALETLVAQCQAGQAELRTLAHLRGARLLAERPKHLKERLETYWRTAEKLAKTGTEAPSEPKEDAGDDMPSEPVEAIESKPKADAGTPRRSATSPRKRAHA